MKTKIILWMLVMFLLVSVASAASTQLLSNSSAVNNSNYRAYFWAGFGSTALDMIDGNDAAGTGAVSYGTSEVWGTHFIHAFLHGNSFQNEKAIVYNVTSVSWYQALNSNYQHKEYSVYLCNNQTDSEICQRIYYYSGAGDSNKIVILNNASGWYNINMIKFNVIQGGTGGAADCQIGEILVNGSIYIPPLPPPPQVKITTRDAFNHSLIETNITIFNSTFSNTSATTNGEVTFFLNNGTYNISIMSVTNQYQPITIPNYNISNDLSANLTFYKSRVTTNYNIRSSQGNSTINIFSLSYYYTSNNSLILSKSTTNGNITALLNYNNSYYATVNAPNYALKNFSFNVTGNYILNQIVFLTKANSIMFYVYDEDNNILISGQNTTIHLYNENSSYKYITNNGTRFIYNITPASYSVSFNTTGYSIRIYTLTVSNQSTQILNAYLTKSTSTTIFTLKDSGTTELIEGALITMYNFVNNSWAAVESKYSDITGRSQFTFNPQANYRFYISKSEYEDLIFYLTPILFSEYTINLQKILTINTSYDYDRVSIIYTESFKEGNNSFTFLIQCPFGELISYGYTLTYPNNTTTNSGSNAIGSTLTDDFTITNPTVFDRVKIDYYYETSLIGLKNYTAYYAISVNRTVGNDTTMSSNHDKTYGMGLFERVIVVVLIGLVIMGISGLVGKIVAGAAITFLVWGYLVMIGFISWYVIGFPVLIGFMVLAFFGGGSR